MSSAAAAAAASSGGGTTTIIVPSGQGYHCNRRERRECHKAGVIVGAAVVAAGAAYLYEKHKCNRRDRDCYTTGCHSSYY